MVRFLKISFLVLALLVAASLLALHLYLRSEAFDRWVHQQAIRALEDRFAVRVDIDRIDVRLFSQEVELEGLRIFNSTYPAESPVIEIGQILLDFSLRHCFWPEISLDRLILDRPRLHFVEDPNGRLNLANMFVSRPRESGGGFSIHRLGIGRIELREGLLVYRDQPIEFSSAAGQMRTELRFEPQLGCYRGTFQASRVDLRIAEVELPQNQMSVSFELYEDRLELPQVELAAPLFEARLQGSISSLRSLAYRFEVDTWAELPLWRQPDLGAHFTVGRVQTRGHFEGTRGDFLFQGEIHSPKLVFHSLPFHQLQGTIHLTPHFLQVGSLQLQFHQGRTDVEGTLRWKEGEVSEFRVRAAGVRIQSLLAQFAPGLVQAGGVAHFQGEFRWPRTEWTGMEGRGRATYRGGLPRDPGLAGQTPSLPFEGDTLVTVAGQEAEFSNGTVRTFGTQIEYTGRVGFDGRYRFDFELNSPRGADTLQVARTAGVVPGEWLHRYPVTPEGPLYLRTRLSGEHGEPQLEGRIVSQGVELEGHPLGTFESALILRPGVLVLQEARLGTSEYQAYLPQLHLPFGEEARRELLRGEATLHHVPVQNLLPLLQTDLPLEGELSGRIQVEEVSVGVFSAQGALRLQEIQLAGEQLSDLQADLVLQDQQVRVSDLTAQLGEGRLTGDGAYHLSRRTYTLRLRGEAIPLEQVQALQKRFPIQGRVRFAVEGSGSLHDPQLHFTLSVPRIQIAGYPLEALRAEGRTQQDRLAFRWEHRFGDNPIEGTGSLQWRAPYHLSARVKGRQILLPPLLRLFTDRDLPDFQGSMDGELAVEGPLAEPEHLDLQALLERIQLSVQGYQLQSDQPARLRYREGTLQLQATTLRGEDTAVRLEGTATLVDRRRIDMRAEGTANLRLLNGFLDTGSTSGGIRLDAVISGPLEEPRIVGRASLGKESLEKGFLFHPRIPVTLFNAEGEFKFTANQISIDSFNADTPYGKINAEGGVFLEGFVPRRWQINAFGSNLRLEYPENLVSIVDVDVDFLRGEKSQLITGAVYLRSAEYSRDTSIPELILEYTRSQALPPPTVGQEDIALDISVETYQGIRIDNNLARVVASGEFTLRGTLENPVILGSMTIDEGTLFLEGNSYELVHASVNFNDPRRTRPVFNFEATTDVREYTISVVVNGPVDKLNVNFRSDPPLPTPSIVSLLAVGQTREQIFGSEETGRTQAGTLAIYGAGQLLSKSLGEQLEARTSRLFGLEKFSIDPFHSPSRGDLGAEITLGKQLTRDLSLTYRTDLTNDRQGQTVIFEYRLTDWLTTVGSRDNDSIAVDFKLRKRF